MVPLMLWPQAMHWIFQQALFILQKTPAINQLYISFAQNSDIFMPCKEIGKLPCRSLDPLPNVAALKRFVVLDYFVDPEEFPDESQPKLSLLLRCKDFGQGDQVIGKII